MQAHVRASYERDIDKGGNAMRVGDNVRREGNHADWLAKAGGGRR
jgi:hypothetical protein